MEATINQDTTVGHVSQTRLSNASAEVASNRFASLWLCFLAILLAGSLFCTAVLVAWPIVA